MPKKKSKPQTLAITAPAKHESSNTPNLTIQLAIRGTPNPTKPRRDIASEFNAYFGNATNLQNWQRLCHDIGLEDDLPSITSCRQALQGVWVNIYDLLDARAVGEFPRHFESRLALARYTVAKGKIFPKKKAKEGGPVRVLLAHIFH